MNYKKKIIQISLFLFLSYQTAVFASSSALLFISKPNINVGVGDRVMISVKAKSTDQAINAVSGVISFPEDILHVVSISKASSVVNLWTRDPSVKRNFINFEGIILNPGYIGQSGNIFDITFEAKKSGQATIGISEGAVLANDGQGTNILDQMRPLTFNITNQERIPETYALATPTQAPLPPSRQVALPVITDYSASVLSPQYIYIKGKGEPNALTKIAFVDTSLKSIGEQFIGYLQTKKKKLNDVFVRNDQKGEFQFQSSNNLVAGAYNATPFLVDQNKNIEKPGLGVQLLVSDSKIVHYLVILINILGLLIPVVGLIVIIYFIPWYSWLRMRLLKKKLGLEEEKIELSEHMLKHQDKIIDSETSGA